MSEILSFVLSHGSEIFAAIAGVVTVAGIVVKLTPTPKDDEVVGKVREWVLKIGGFLGWSEPHVEGTKLPLTAPRQPVPEQPIIIRRVDRG